MAKAKKKSATALLTFAALSVSGILVAGCLVYAFYYSDIFSITYSAVEAEMQTASTTSTVPALPPLNVAEYDTRMLALAHVKLATSSSATSTATTTKKTLWPVKTVYPNAGAILPFKRIVAYYGNFYSKQMGVLGEYGTDVLLSKFRAEIATWEAADPSTPVMPAIEYIAVTAQGSAQKDGTYRLRMPDSQIDKALELAKKVNGIVILDIQVGLSTVQKETPELEKYLSMPNVHLALDPEFSMKTGAKPGTVIGTMSSADINWAANYLAGLVKKNNLPPKLLIVHRFTQPMVTGYKNITPLPEVQIVMDMDGWGSPIRKTGSYQAFIYPEPVQFTGIKLFYKNDLRSPSTRLMTSGEVLKLTPSPIFIQYQ